MPPSPQHSQNTGWRRNSRIAFVFALLAFMLAVLVAHTTTQAQSTAVQYVRLEAISEVNGNPWTTMAEFNLVDGSGALIPRTGWTVVADSQETAAEDGRAVNAIDGDANTIWHTDWSTTNAALPHTFTVYLATARVIGGFRYLPRNDGANGHIAGWRFYTSSNGTTWTQVGQGTFTYSSAEKSVTLSAPANQSPTLATVANQSGNVGTAASLTLSGSDPDSDPLTYSATGLPAGLSLAASTGVISGTPTTVSTYNVTATVSDGKGGTASRSFTWTIAAAVNQPPTLATVANQTGGVGRAASLTLSGSDPNGDTLTYSATGLPAGLSLASATGVISGTPTTAATYSVTATVSDGRGGTASRSFTWTIAANTAPTLATVANQTGNVGTAASLTLSGSDADADVLTYSATGLPAGLSLVSATGVISGTPTTAATYSVTATVSDGRGGSASRSFTWTIAAAANQPPTLAAVANQTGGVGRAASLALSGSDPNGDTLSYSATGLPAGLSVAAATGVISGTPTTAATYSVTATVSDGRGGSASRSFTWTIAANTTPALAAVANQSGTVGTAASLTLSGSDADADTLSYAATGLPTGMNLASATGVISGTPTAAGTYSVTATVSDGRGGSASRSFTWTIAAAANQAPTLATVANQTGTVGTAVSLTLSGSDADGDTLSYSATGLPAGLTVASATGVISGTPTTASSYSVTATVSDGRGGSASRSFTWTIASTPTGGAYQYVRLEALSEVNGNPWTTMAEFNLVDGSGALIPRTGWTVVADSQETAAENGAAANAIDGDVNTIWHTDWSTTNAALPHTFTVNLGTARVIGGFRYLPRNDGANGHIANWRFYTSSNGTTWTQVGQGTFTYSSAEKSVTVSAPANQSPTLATVANQSGTVGTAASLTLSGSDPDGDALSYSATGLPAGLSLAAPTGVISGTPTTATTYNVTATVSDGRGGSASRSFTWTIVAANQPPTLATVANQTGTVGTAASLTLSASDPNGDTLSYSATGLPAGLSIVTTTGVISGTPTTVGTSNVTASVSDGRGGTASRSFTWTVAAANQPPTLAVVANQSGTVGTASSLTLSGADPDGDTLSYSATGLPAGLSIVASTGVISGTPTTATTYNVTVTVSDGRGGSASRSFTWTIAGANQPPTLAVVADQTGTIGTAVNLTLSGSDPNGDTLSYAATGLPAGLSIAASTGVISGTPTTATTYNVTATVSDGRGGSASRSFTWTIAAANQPPTLAVVANQSGTVGTVASLTLTGSDPDGDALSYSATGLPAGLSLVASTGVISGTPTTAATYNVTATVSDGKGGSASRSFTWSIATGNSPSIQGQVRYYYDELNRLVEVVAADGTSAQYAYDAAGNITLVRRNAASALGLAEFTPKTGSVGTTVTLYGSGFNTTPAGNTVTFNGVNATVNAATATALNVTVPASATTGLITVTVGSSSASTASNFVVGSSPQAPTIIGFTPQIGQAGTVVTVTGTNFQLVADDNKVTLGQGAVSLVRETGNPSASQLKLSVGTAASGKVAVTTPYGRSVSASDFYALPAGVAATDVEFMGRIVVDGATATVTTNSAGRKAVLLFDAQVGQFLHLVTTSSSFASPVSASVYGPTGALLETVSLSASTVSDFTKRIGRTGTYTVVLSPLPSDRGSLALNLVTDQAGSLVMDGSTSISISAGRNGRYSFEAEANRGYGLALLDLAFTPEGSGNLLATLLDARGNFLAQCNFSASNSCDFAPSNFAATGTYLITFDAQGIYAVTFNAVLSKDTGGPIAVDAALATTVTIARAGQNGRYTFSGSAGQNLSVVLMGSTIDNGNAATTRYTYVYVYPPSSTTSQLGFGYIPTGATSATVDISLQETGTYTILVNPLGLDTGSVNLQVKSYVTGTLAVDGGTPIDLSAGRNGRYSFVAEANKGYGLALTGLNFTPTGGAVNVTLSRADGTLLTQCYFSANNNSCDLAPSNFATAGTYLLDFDPQGVYAASFNAVLSKDTGGAIAVDAVSATLVTISRAGQNGRYTFSGTAGQNISVVLTGNTLDDGDTATINYTYVYVYPPSSATSQVGFVYLTPGATSATVDVALTETGTYTIYLAPSGLDRGSVELAVKSYLTGTLAVDGSTAINVGAGRNARYSFSAEAGKGYGLALTALTFVPTGGSLNATLSRADGTYLAQCSFTASGNSCDFSPSKFPTAGTYLIDFDPSGINVATFNAVLSKDTGGAITIDAASATAVNIARAGQNGRYTFNGSAGQNVSVVLAGSTIDDGDSATMSYTYVYVYPPSSATGDVGFGYLQAGASSATIDLALAETGEYTIFINPLGLDVGAVNLQVKSYLTGTLNVDGSTAIDLSAGRNARYTFTAEVNKGYGLALTSLSFVPSGGYVRATLSRSDGTYLAQCNFYGGESCDFAPSNFAVAGTYSIDFDPQGINAAAFSAVLSKDTGVPIVVDAAAATTVTIARAGQNGRYTFSGTAGQNVTLVLSGNTLDDGDAATNNYTYVYVYPPSSATGSVGYAYLYTGTSGATGDFALPETGTYTIFVNPARLDTGSINVAVKSYLTGTLAVDGSTAISLSSGRNARYSFTAEAGKGYGLALTGLAFTPVGGSLTATLLAANGTYIAQCSFNSSNSCGLAPSNFAVAGTYLIDFDPSYVYAASFSAVLSSEAMGTLTVNAAAPTPVTLARAGQNARYTFSGTAGQVVNVILSGSTLDDGDSATTNYTYASVYGPGASTNYVGSSSFPTGSSGVTFNVTLPSTGIYTLFVDPTGLDSGSISLTGSRQIEPPS